METQVWGGGGHVQRRLGLCGLGLRGGHVEQRLARGGLLAPVLGFLVHSRAGNVQRQVQAWWLALVGGFHVSHGLAMFSSN